MISRKGKVSTQTPRHCRTLGCCRLLVGGGGGGGRLGQRAAQPRPRPSPAPAQPSPPAQPPSPQQNQTVASAFSICFLTSGLPHHTDTLPIHCQDRPLSPSSWASPQCLLLPPSSSPQPPGLHPLLSPQPQLKPPPHTPAFCSASPWPPLSPSQCVPDLTALRAPEIPPGRPSASAGRLAGRTASPSITSPPAPHPVFLSANTGSCLGSGLGTDSPTPSLSESSSALRPQLQHHLPTKPH